MSTSVIGFLITFIQIFGQLYVFAIMARVILSWFPARPTRLHYFLQNVTEPLLSSLRRMVPPLVMIDLSPILAYFLVNMAVRLVVTGLVYLEPFVRQLIG